MKENENIETIENPSNEAASIDKDTNAQVEVMQTNAKGDNSTFEENTEIDDRIQPKKKQKHWLYRHFFKRLFDILLSGLGLIVLSPVLLVLSIIVRIKHGSPILFTQPRPGKNNKLFKFSKFRSMTNARDENGALLPDDQRITKFGKMLRKTSLDELPQLWSIFKGDMSIVGPRPKLVQDMVFYNDEQNRRSEVRPGLTGLAQANGRNLNSWKETFEYDIYYVDNCSLWLDIKIIFKTALKIIKKSEITDTNATADHYHFGKHLLNNNVITQEEYDDKIEEAKKLMTENNFKSDINTVNQNKVV
jgi:undecaprenyl phosphate N,N'-diacetylbacillosamine 1-phosphate transferase